MSTEIPKTSTALVHLHSVAILAAFLVIADGKIDFEEWSALDSLIDDQEFERHVFIEVLEKYVHELEEKGPAYAKALIHRSGYGLDPDRIEGLFENFIDIVLSNNDIDSGEIDILIHIRKILRIEEDDFVARLIDRTLHKSRTADLTLSFVEHSKELF